MNSQLTFADGMWRRYILTFIVLTAAIGLFVERAFADCNANSCTGEIENFYLNGDMGRLMLTTTGDEGNLNCALFEGKFLTLDVTHPSFNELYALLLVVKATQATARVRIHDYSSGCSISYVMYW